MFEILFVASVRQDIMGAGSSCPLKYTKNQSMTLFIQSTSDRIRIARSQPASIVNQCYRFSGSAADKGTTNPFLNNNGDGKSLAEECTCHNRECQHHTLHDTYLYPPRMFSSIQHLPSPFLVVTTTSLIMGLPLYSFTDRLSVLVESLADWVKFS